MGRLHLRVADRSRFILLGCGIAIAALLPSVAEAQNSLGIGRPEQAIQPQGIFAGVLFWIQQKQQEFYQLMTGALKSIRDGDSAFWWLTGLSFAYGVLHAAGPGHGKAVISSYMLANEVVLRRGIFLAFASALLQAIVAVAAIGLLLLFLRNIGLRQSELTFYLEVASYAGVTLLGLWLLGRKLNQLARPAAKLADKPASIDCSHPAHETHHHHHHHATDTDVTAHGKVASQVCPSCGHAHMADPEMISKDKLSLGDAWLAVLAVGLRPCTGALIVLTFAFLNGLYWAGIASAFAMAIGTAITVSLIASMAVGAKNAVFRLAGKSSSGAVYFHTVEIGGALLVLFFGVTLLAASLASA